MTIVFTVIVWLLGMIAYDMRAKVRGTKSANWMDRCGILFAAFFICLIAFGKL